jgi:hypothetical protein
MARVVFGGHLDPNPNAVAAGLRRAGYEVYRLGPQHPKLDHPRDDFIECVTTVTKDFEITVIDGIGHASDEGIVRPYRSCEWIDAN